MFSRNIILSFIAATIVAATSGYGKCKGLPVIGCLLDHDKCCFHHPHTMKTSYTSWASTPSPTPTPSSVSVSVSISSSVVPSSSCVPPAPTNALVNGGFETGAMEPWTATNNGFAGAGFDAPGVQTFAGFGALGTNSYYQTVQRIDGIATYTLTQTNVPVLSGTTIACSAYLMTVRNPGTTTSYTLTVDGVLCAAAEVGDQEAWTLFDGTLVVVGDTHTVTVSWTSTGVDEAGSLHDVDEISILPIAGPGVPTTCAAVDLRITI